MRFLHLSDLHIGKRLNGFSLLEDQKHILNEILKIVAAHMIDAVIIAGDVYDSPTPPVEAVTVLDSFLTELIEKNKLIFIISGNHDSPERLSFGSDIMKSQGIYIEGNFKGTPAFVELTDSFGKLNIYMLPFIKPAQVSAFYGERVETFEEAVKLALSKTKIDKNERNILIAHQFVTYGDSQAERSDSETKYAGGLDNVDYSVFCDFDYVALGHLHCPQKIGREAVVYGGSPLKYSVSERFQRKCAIIAELCEKGEVKVERIPLEPLRDLRQIKGPFETLLDQPKSDDYISVVLTDTKRHIEPLKRLSTVFCNCISLEYEGDRETTEDASLSASVEDVSGKSHMEIFQDFYFERNAERFDSAASKYLAGLIDEIVDGGL